MILVSGEGGIGNGARGRGVRVRGPPVLGPSRQSRDRGIESLEPRVDVSGGSSARMICARR
eukprot:14235565-Alexandrium_andersonii.AAC.1